jgi:SanA protein
MATASHCYTKWWIMLATVLLVPVMGLLIADQLITFQARSAIVERIEDVPVTPVALVLGTARLHQGRPNLFYRARIDLAAELYHSGRIDGLLLSGDNGTIYYNEPVAMYKDLLALGVPKAAMTLDYAGFRTLDSVVRAKRVFGLDRCIIISQRFHVERAVVLAHHVGLDAIGLVAADPNVDTIRAREIFARSAAWLDIILNKQPRFLGESERLNLCSVISRCSY